MPPAQTPGWKPGDTAAKMAAATGAVSNRNPTVFKFKIGRVAQTSKSAVSRVS
jgi:hypothetical protein